MIKHNGFRYENKFNRQITGSAMSSTFTLMLADIFMSERQSVNRLKSSNQKYMDGKFRTSLQLLDISNDTFFTSNESYESMETTLYEANCFHPSIRLVRQICVQECHSSICCFKTEKEF